MVNSIVQTVGRERQDEIAINERVRLMARISSIKDSIRQYQITLVQLERELDVMNEKYAKRSQTNLFA